MTIHEWVRKLEEQDTPVFRQTALQVADIAADPDSGTDALTRLIVRDPLLTTKVLKLSNSAFYNPSGRPIKTVARALMLLGMERVRAICLSVALVEVLQKGKRLDRVRRELARALLAAVIARSIAQESQAGSLDEIFISALLMRIGPLLFWCVGEEEATTLDGVLRETQDDASVEKAVLGFQLSHISLLLAEDWKLSPLLVEILRGRTMTGSAQAVLIGWETSTSVGFGWSDRRVRLSVSRIADHVVTEPALATTLLARAVRDARTWAMEIGAEELCAFLPEPPAEGEEMMALHSPREEERSVESAAPIRVPRLANGLRELESLTTYADLTHLPETMLEALHVGLGMDRAWFCPAQPSTGELRCRAAVGDGAAALVGRWHFVQRTQMADSLSRSLEQNAPFLYDPSIGARAPSLPESVEQTLDGVSFVFLPVQVQGRLLGAFCADRAASRRSLDPTAREGFRMLCERLEQTLARMH